MWMNVKQWEYLEWNSIIFIAIYFDIVIEINIICYIRIMFLNHIGNERYNTLDIKIGGANTHFKTNDRSICLSFIFPFHNSSVEETMDGKEQDQVSMIRWHDDIQGLNTFVKMETVYKVL